MRNERLIGMVLGEAGVPCARLIARMLAQGGGDIPDTPTSYLYGRVAAEGETPDVIIDGVGYKGAVLPKRPEWDRKTYPYALLHRGENETDGVYYVFLVGNMKPYHLANGVHFSGAGYKAFESYTYNPYTTWGEFGDTYGWRLSSNIFWANTDILDEDGSVYMEASEPIPVYE